MIFTSSHGRACGSATLRRGDRASAIETESQVSDTASVGSASVVGNGFAGGFGAGHEDDGGDDGVAALDRPYVGGVGGAGKFAEAGKRIAVAPGGAVTAVGVINLAGRRAVTLKTQVVASFRQSITKPMLYFEHKIREPIPCLPFCTLRPGHRNQIWVNSKTPRARNASAIKVIPPPTAYRACLKRLGVLGRLITNESCLLAS